MLQPVQVADDRGHGGAGDGLLHRGQHHDQHECGDDVAAVERGLFDGGVDLQRVERRRDLLLVGHGGRVGGGWGRVKSVAPLDGFICRTIPVPWPAQV